MHQDEIGTEAEALAARSISQRGVQLVATAHGGELTRLIKNPTLSDLIGGIQTCAPCIPSTPNCFAPILAVLCLHVVVVPQPVVQVGGEVGMPQKVHVPC